MFEIDEQELLAEVGRLHLQVLYLQKQLTAKAEAACPPSPTISTPPSPDKI